MMWSGVSAIDHSVSEITVRAIAGPCAASYQVREEPVALGALARAYA